MFYFDFGKDVVVRVGVASKKKLKRYTAFSNMAFVPLDARYQAQTIIFERSNGTCEWMKNRWHATKELNEEELKQFVFQKLATEFV